MSPDRNSQSEMTRDRNGQTENSCSVWPRSCYDW